MAVFGIPFVHTDPEAIKQDAHRAIAAAIAMQKRLKRLNKQLQAEGKPTIEIGIGIHTGLVVAGSVGGKRRLNYSVLGDTVNVAARLEPMNKEVKGDNPYKLIVSGKTFAHVGDRYEAYQVGTTQLRGREQQTTIYCILGKKKKQRLPQPKDDIAPKVKISV
jgi:class 3 adenylate cyclase